jgi:hypothetical protein
LFRFNFAGEKVAGFINLTFDDVAFRHLDNFFTRAGRECKQRSQNSLPLRRSPAVPRGEANVERSTFWTIMNSVSPQTNKSSR